jgi:hypothetical protein
MLACYLHDKGNAAALGKHMKKGSGSQLSGRRCIDEERADGANYEISTSIVELYNEQVHP